MELRLNIWTNYNAFRTALPGLFWTNHSDHGLRHFWGSCIGFLWHSVSVSRLLRWSSDVGTAQRRHTSANCCPKKCLFEISDRPVHFFWRNHEPRPSSLPVHSVRRDPGFGTVWTLKRENKNHLILLRRNWKRFYFPIFEWISLFFSFFIIFLKQTIVGCHLFFSTHQNPGFHPGKITFLINICWCKYVYLIACNKKKTYLLTSQLSSSVTVEFKCHGWVQCYSWVQVSQLSSSVTVGFKCHSWVQCYSWVQVSQLSSMLQLGSSVTDEFKCHSWVQVLLLGSSVTIEFKCHNWVKVSQLNSGVTVEFKCHSWVQCYSWVQVSQLGSSVTVEFKCYSWVQVSQSSSSVTVEFKCHSWVQVSQLSSSVTVGFKCHSWVQVSQLSSSGTVELKCHS